MVNFRLIISNDCETARYILIKHIFTAPFFAVQLSRLAFTETLQGNSVMTANTVIDTGQ